ncbi:thiol-disulfide isomerase/thioredoxin [Ureibacillus xyleni]|uniref:Thiol-disulfide isomerase/thioredoxin n=1 Tax=Ureibacillus xyleni TaxID=614648 RepID=A0A285TLH9_9BACL|nr:thioredoxin family protein [Ureibacillus xyleni]SOC23555.1 thiol-disulfide isomerase/thioredoxin [Ureibacillus xyleni]
MENLQSLEQFEQLKLNGRTIFMFSADWCGDCRFIDPVMPAIEEKYTDYRFVKVDRDEYIDLCIKLDIFGIPSFLAYNNGEEIGRFVSKDRKTQEEIEAFINGLN